ncbi:MAG: packaged DNA stabilization protein [Plesiomonas shigelloides]
MPEIQVPLVKGQGKSQKNVDYIDRLPVNIVPIKSEAEGANGYFRFWPGIEKVADVDGVSRGSHWNTVKNDVYRVAGGKLYLGVSEVGGVAGSGRVSMAHSRTSQAAASNGSLTMYRYDGEVKTLSNWPDKDVIPGYTKTIQEAQHSKDGDTLKLTTATTNGKLTLTITPINGSNKQGDPISISEAEWQDGKGQSAPASGIPYLTDIKVSGGKYPGAILSVTYKFNANGGSATDISKLAWVQVVGDSETDNPQYDFSPVKDVCRLRGRYIFCQDGTDKIWVTSIEDESKIDKFAPEYRAESQPDGIHAVREFRDYVLAFGSSTIEWFRLTGDAQNLLQGMSQYLTPIGIAGQFCLTEFNNTFAFITSPSKGQVTVGLMGQGTWEDIADRNTKKILAKYTPDQLESCFIESLKDKDNQFLILHLPDETVCYNATTGLWMLLKTGLYGGAHRAIDYRNKGDVITCGDKLSPQIGELSEVTSSQYGEDQEIILFSPFIKYENAIVSDLSIVPNSGLASTAQRIFISVTEDGVIYSPERMLEYDNRFEWLKNPIMRRIGRIRMRMGFKLRIVGADPCTISDFRVRVD